MLAIPRAIGAGWLRCYPGARTNKTSIGLNQIGACFYKSILTIALHLIIKNQISSCEAYGSVSAVLEPNSLLPFAGLDCHLQLRSSLFGTLQTKRLENHNNRSRRRMPGLHHYQFTEATQVCSSSFTLSSIENWYQRCIAYRRLHYVDPRLAVRQVHHDAPLSI
jgi:hypothetical protein